MKRSTRNRVRGKIRKLAGRAKQRAGRATGDARLEGEGIDDQVAGAVQDAAGKIQRKLEE